MPYIITLNRVYDAIHASSGKAARVLTDRLWPRGLRKEALGDIQWLHEASPTPELRKGLHKGDISLSNFSAAINNSWSRTPTPCCP